MKRFLVLLAAMVITANAGAQTISGVGAVLHPLNPHDLDDATDVTTFASGPRLVSSNGGVWFLESGADRIAFFKNDVITEWPVRSHTYQNPFRSIGANPADFELDADGHTIWFIENGNSGIDINESVFAKLDTSTNQMTEWIVPVSKPAGFLRQPGGIVWLPMSQGSLVRLDLNTLQGIAYRDGVEFSGFSGMIQDPDGNFYLSDFGSNRLLKIDPQTLIETSWETFDPNTVRNQITQPTLDGAGNIWVAESVSGGSIASLNLSTGEYDRFGAGGLNSPSHFFIQGKLVYGVETDPLGGDGSIVIIDTSNVATNVVMTTPTTATLVSQPIAASTVRSTVLTPITFQSSDASPDSAVVANSPQTGISRFILPHGTNFPSTTSYSIVTIDGKIFSGVRGAIAEFTLLPAAQPSELVVPFAVNAANTVIRTDIVAYHENPETSVLTATFYASPVPPSPSGSFNITSGVTLGVSDALGPQHLNVGDATGSLRFTSSPANSGFDQAWTRSYALVANNGTYGFSLPAQLVSSVLSADSALFLHTQDGETSGFGIYSPTGGSGTATLHRNDGSIRGTYPFFLPANNRQEFNPASTAFGVSSEAGDYITFDVNTGSLFPYSAIGEQTGDVAAGLPIAPSTSAIFPAVGARTNSATSSVVSDVLLANTGSSPANVTLTFYPLDPSLSPTSSSLTIASGASATVAYRDPAAGFGALVLTSSSPICAEARYANHTPAGDYAGLASPVAPVAHGRFLLSPDPHLRNNLMVFNNGDAGRANVLLYDASGALKGSFGFAMEAHRLIILFDMNTYSGMAGGGRIEVFSAGGASLSSWVASTDRVTGDSDAQPPQSLP